MSLVWCCFMVGVCCMFGLWVVCLLCGLGVICWFLLVFVGFCGFLGVLFGVVFGCFCVGCFGFCVVCGWCFCVGCFVCVCGVSGCVFVIVLWGCGGCLLKYLSVCVCVLVWLKMKMLLCKLWSIVGEELQVVFLGVFMWISEKDISNYFKYCGYISI